MNYFFLTHTPLLQGITQEEAEALLPCLRAREERFKKDAFIFRAGEAVREIGLVLSGSVNIAAHFYWGGRHIFDHVGQGALFGENYAAIPGQELPCDVVAAEDTHVLFLSMEPLLTTCQRGCAFHQRIIHNLVRISAMKNLNLTARMHHIAPKSIRDRLLSYLSAQAVQTGAGHFFIPFSRQQLADYLGVDRSALSNELSKMRRDGLIEFHKNEFTLLDQN